MYFFVYIFVYIKHSDVFVVDLHAEYFEQLLFIQLLFTKFL